MSKIYGYCRVSSPKQNIDRQIRNIKAKYENAIMVKETFTGAKVEGRKEFQKLLNKIKEGDTIIFDSVSRMSRNSDEGFEIYEKLFNQGVELVFLNESHINTATYKKALISNQLQPTGTNVDLILEGINKYLLELAKEQIKIAFEQSEKEVKDISQRTREGIEIARLNGKQIGQVKGTKLTTKKSLEAKKIIKQHSVDFGGSLTDKELIQFCSISRNSFYKYKRELREEIN